MAGIPDDVFDGPRYFLFKFMAAHGAILLGTDTA